MSTNLEGGVENLVTATGDCYDLIKKADFQPADFKAFVLNMQSLTGNSFNGNTSGNRKAPKISFLTFQDSGLDEASILVEYGDVQEEVIANIIPENTFGYEIGRPTPPTFASLLRGETPLYDVNSLGETVSLSPTEVQQFCATIFNRCFREKLFVRIR